MLNQENSLMVTASLSHNVQTGSLQQQVREKASNLAPMKVRNLELQTKLQFQQISIVNPP